MSLQVNSSVLQTLDVRLAKPTGARVEVPNEAPPNDSGGVMTRDASGAPPMMKMPPILYLPPEALSDGNELPGGDTAAAVFKSLDADEDGVISTAELAQARQAAGAPKAGGLAYGFHDRNGDGVYADDEVEAHRSIRAGLTKPTMGAPEAPSGPASAPDRAAASPESPDAAQHVQDYAKMAQRLTDWLRHRLEVAGQGSTDLTA